MSEPKDEVKTFTPKEHIYLRRPGRRPIVVAEAGVPISREQAKLFAGEGLLDLKTGAAPDTREADLAQARAVVAAKSAPLADRMAAADAVAALEAKH